MFENGPHFLGHLVENVGKSSKIRSGGRNYGLVLSSIMSSDGEVRNLFFTFVKKRPPRNMGEIPPFSVTLFLFGHSPTPGNGR